MSGTTAPRSCAIDTVANTPATASIAANEDFQIQLVMLPFSSSGGAGTTLATTGRRLPANATLRRMRSWALPTFAIVVPLGLATSVAREPIEQDVLGSSRIARVEVVGFEEQTFLFEGRIESCGVAYRLAVKDDLAGGEQPFWALSRSGETPAEKGTQLFVIAYDVDESFRTRFMETMEQAPALVRERARCSFRSREWHSARLLLSFDRDAAKEFGGEWLRTNGDGPNWSEDLGRRRVEQGAASYEVVSWPLVRKAVAAELGRAR